MIRFYFFLFIIIAPLFCSGQKDWQKKGVKIAPPICYASDHSHKHFTAPPDAYLKKLKSTAEKRATIIVDYIDFSEEPKAAFQKAVDIWESLIYSPVPIYMTARWTSLDEEVLGSCGPYIFFENFDAAHFKDRYYPVALVEKMEGEEITGPDVPDMVAQFNKDNANWYFGIDGNTPEDKYDFVSIVLHEIAHGLGFTGFFYQENEAGAYGGALEIPGVFDEFVTNYSRERLVDTTFFQNHSIELYDALTSYSLYNNSPTAIATDEHNRTPRLWAPDPFDEGSSIYHLHEHFYATGDINSLMTPFADKGAANHNPGPYTLGIFADMGWQFISIKHHEIRDSETITGTIPIEAIIYSDAPLDTSSVTLYYTESDFELESNTIVLTYNKPTQNFSANISDLAQGEIKYYIEASDVNGHTYRLPGIAPEKYFDFILGPDEIKPVIEHDPLISMLESDQNAEIYVDIQENIGIADAKIEYRINNQNTQNITLTLDSATIYKGVFAFNGLTDGDSVSYRIRVTDSSSNANVALLPEDGYFTFHIDGTFSPVMDYYNDFDTNSRDFITSDFYTATEPGFNNGALHSPHPYPSPDKDDTTFDFTAILKYPITIKEGGKVTYKEVVLIEPGEEDTPFGDENFWDYAIVEGSLNGVDNWLPLIDGYDSRDNESWLQLYDVGVNGNNSSSIGNNTLFVNRSFYLTENNNFEVGETIFLRFRIFSDPYAHGWGWAIDDLSIQDPINSSVELDYSPGEITVFPNPVKSQLYIRADFNKNIDELSIKLLTSSGILISEKQLTLNSHTINESYNLNSLSPGLYLLIFSFDNGQTITRKVVKQ